MTTYRCPLCCAPNSALICWAAVLQMLFLTPALTHQTRHNECDWGKKLLEEQSCEKRNFWGAWNTDFWDFSDYEDGLASTNGTKFHSSLLTFHQTRLLTPNKCHAPGLAASEPVLWSRSLSLLPKKTQQKNPRYWVKIAELKELLCQCGFKGVAPGSTDFLE